MDIINELLGNRLLIIPIISWGTAQILKTGIHALVNKGFRAERLVGGGGMPSAHSATVCSLALTCAMEFGLGSFEFAMASVFGIVTMYDAMNVRLETGRQGEALNDLLEAFNKISKEKIGPDKALKELIGHTPLQVLVGGLLGIGIACIAYFCF